MNGAQKWTHTHHLADLFNLWSRVYSQSSGDVRHHEDFNKRNNHPRNIVRMGWHDHFRLHVSLASENAKRLWQKPEYRRKMVRVMREFATRQWADPEHRRA